jgi:hypothetical protein
LNLLSVGIVGRIALDVSSGLGTGEIDDNALVFLAPDGVGTRGERGEALENWGAVGAFFVDRLRHSVKCRGRVVVLSIYSALALLVCSPYISPSCPASWPASFGNRRHKLPGGD